MPVMHVSYYRNREFCLDMVANHNGILMFPARYVNNPLGKDSNYKED